MKCSVYRLNKQGDSKHPCPTSFMILNQPGVSYRVLLLLDYKHCREPAYCILSAYCVLSAYCILHIAYWVQHFPQHHLSGSGILNWNSITAGSRSSAHDKGHEEGGSAHAKAGSSLRSTPGNSQASTPKTRVCLLSALCFHLHLWLYGGLSPTTSLWKKS